MKIQKWIHFIPQQFVAAGKDSWCITFQCTNQEASEMMDFVEAELKAKVWVVDCKTTSGAGGWAAAAAGSCTYSLSFETLADYQRFLTKYDTP